MRISILILGFKGLKVYSKSFASNKFNDFAGYSPVVHVHYMFSYMLYVQLYVPKDSISKDQSAEETEENKYNCTIYSFTSLFFTLRLIPRIVIISYAIFQLIIVYLGM